MTNPIAQRLAAMRESLGLSKKDMATTLEIPPTTYLAYESDDGPPKVDWLGRLHAMGFDLNWLISGEGAMGRNQAANSLNEPSTPFVAPGPDIDTNLLAAIVIAVQRYAGAEVSPEDRAKAIATLYRDTALRTAEDVRREMKALGAKE